MKYVELGRCGLTVSVAGLGGGSRCRFGLVGDGTPADAERLIHSALDLGITLFDSSGAIGGTDRILGDALRGRRDEAVISTKVHLGPDLVLPPANKSRVLNRACARLAASTGTVASPRTIVRRIERALAALRTDTIDLLSLHAVTPGQYAGVVTRLAPALQQLKQEGKIRAIGLTEAVSADPEHRMLQQALAEPFADVMMVGFGPLRRKAASTVIPLARKRGVGIIAMFAARASFVDAPMIAERLAGSAGISDEEAHRRAQQIVERMGAAGIDNPASAAYRYAYDQPGVDAVLVGTASHAHLRQNVETILDPALDGFDVLDEH